MSDNVANEKKKFELPEGYQPMGGVAAKLAVPEKPGYQRRWFKGTAGRIQQAQRAGYRFVDPEEVGTNNFDLGGDAKASGNTDLGNSRVSVVAGADGEGGQSLRMYLMEIPNELYEHGRSFMAERNESIAATIRGDGIGAGSNGESRADAQNRYIDKSRTNLTMFTPKSKRS